MTYGPEDYLRARTEALAVGAVARGTASEIPEALLAWRGMDLAREHGH